MKFDDLIDQSFPHAAKYARAIWKELKAPLKARTLSAWFFENPLLEQEHATRFAWRISTWRAENTQAKEDEFDWQMFCAIESLYIEQDKILAPIDPNPDPNDEKEWPLTDYFNAYGYGGVRVTLADDNSFFIQPSMEAPILPFGANFIHWSNAMQVCNCLAMFYMQMLRKDLDVPENSANDDVLPEGFLMPDKTLILPS